MAPWTSRTIVEEVLPDLFEAAGNGAQPTEFRFITISMGRMRSQSSSSQSATRIEMAKVQRISIP
ncbi:hypothetical protein X769_13805 [Mesorhizobium sp. LSJC268A00]|nr:hypothetical protein X769_13805 [Mesorhizobium sp. LSJC268A00]ESX46889.1 hypothetical protein X762_20270 [Mesorhizobium sp. LSHC426A00]ESX57007.1 hypothetical protein X760_22660 [Mesorhizobium sp. LSHC422A00]ESX59255.1 hypothetical protein X761_00600 [Mesorhizobium sp. LSHC424B00]ESX72289.1 hypothetical protein X758_12485 [Mesorhizobium sp. LSHC416B00]ESX78531.1 hypothetical protein X757_09525 [Mesorhizobium sp. LSHC414A00]ESZ57074.1 hypothetical protein X728_24435 [Mesorhizobium sp. L103C